MTEITAEAVKQLRERTGVGMAKCKEALQAANGDMELAIANLRKAGMASAVKKEGRETREGAIGLFEDSRAVALLEINSETDFVARNEKFSAFLNEMAKEVAATRPASVEAFLKQKSLKDPAHTIDELRGQVVQVLGENIQVRRLAVWEKGADASIGAYSHMGGKIVVLVEMSGASGEEALAREIAMHAAAEAPEYLVPEEVPASVKANEEEIARSQVLASGKPANVVDKIVAGKLQSYFDTVCLACQKYIKDPSHTVAQVVEQRAKEKGKALQLKRFIRWVVGQG